MVLDRLKKIRRELEESALIYDRAFQKTAIIAARELSDKQESIADNLDIQAKQLPIPTPRNSKQYYLDRYGSLKDAKVAYRQQYPQAKFGKSWDDFLDRVNSLESNEATIQTKLKVVKSGKNLAIIIPQNIVDLVNLCEGRSISIEVKDNNYLQLQLLD